MDDVVQENETRRTSEESPVQEKVMSQKRIRERIRFLQEKDLGD